MGHFCTRLIRDTDPKYFIGGERAGSSVHEDQDPVLQPGAAAGGDQAVLHQGEDTRQCAPLIQVLLRKVSRGDP